MYQRQSARLRSSRSSQAGGYPAKCYRSNGGMSTSRDASCGSTHTRQRTTFPFTDALQQLLEVQKAEHDRLKAEGVLCPWVFQRTGKKVKGKAIVQLLADSDPYGHNLGTVARQSDARRSISL